MLLQLSDLHVGAAGFRDPLADATDAVRAVQALRPTPEAVLISGDLAEHGSPAEYALVRELLAELALPVHVVPGNHDVRAALHAAFPVGGDPAGAYRWTARCGGLRLIGCDTGRPGRVDGWLPAAERAWLSARLAEDPVTPTVIAMHHPPMAVGMPAFDDVGLDVGDRAALGDLLDGAPHVQRVVAGHVHLAATGRIGRVAVVTCPSTWRERPRLELGAEEYEIVDEPAGMLLHVLVDGELVSHLQQLPLGTPPPAAAAGPRS